MSAAWELIGSSYAAEHKNLVRYARTLVGNDAEDVVHEAYIKFAEACDVVGRTYDAGAMPTIVQRACIDYLRARPAEAAILKPELVESHPVTNEAWQFSQDFNEALQTLPPKQAQAFILCDVRGVSQEEAARITGTSQPTVCRRVETARHSLASLL